MDELDDQNNQMIPEMEQTAPQQNQGLDPRLQDALDQRKKTQLNADLLRSFQQLIQAGATGTGYKADMSMADSIERRANEPIDLYKMQVAQEAGANKSKQEADRHKIFMDEAKLKMQSANIKMEDAERGKDPTSTISRISQDLAKTYFKMSGQPYNEDTINNTSGDDLIKLIPDIQKAGLEYFRDSQVRAKMESDERIASERNKLEEDKNAKLAEMEARRQREQDARRDQEDVKERQQQINTARGLIKDDPRFKKAMEQSMEFDSVNELIGEAEKGNQQAVGALGTKLARAMGEVGVLTDTDVVRYIAGQSWGRQLKDWFTKGAQGELSPETIKGIKANLKILKTKLDSDVNKVHTKAYDRMKAAYPKADDTFIKGVLGMGPSSSQSSNMVQMRDPKGNIRMVPKDKVEAAKAAGGEVVE